VKVTRVGEIRRRVRKKKIRGERERKKKKLGREKKLRKERREKKLWRKREKKRGEDKEKERENHILIILFHQNLTSLVYNACLNRFRLNLSATPIYLTYLT
jgi:hypothetical protein